MSIEPADVTAEIHGYSHPDATPTPWEQGITGIVINHPAGSEG